MNLNDKIHRMRLEEIRVFLSSLGAREETTQSALNLVISSFYDKYFNEIREANFGDK